MNMLFHWFVPNIYNKLVVQTKAIVCTTSFLGEMKDNRATLRLGSNPYYYELTSHLHSNPIVMLKPSLTFKNLLFEYFCFWLIWSNKGDETIHGIYYPHRKTWKLFHCFVTKTSKTTEKNSIFWSSVFIILIGCFRKYYCLFISS